MFILARTSVGVSPITNDPSFPIRNRFDLVWEGKRKVKSEGERWELKGGLISGIEN